MRRRRKKKKRKKIEQYALIACASSSAACINLCSIEGEGTYCVVVYTVWQVSSLPLL